MAGNPLVEMQAAAPSKHTWEIVLPVVVSTQYLM